MRRRLVALLAVSAAALTGCGGVSAGATATVQPTDPPVQAAATAAADPTPTPTTEPTAQPTVASPAEPTAPPATGQVAVSMTEMRFEPVTITVPVGEPVTFLVSNDGVIQHEFFIGDEAEQQQHAKEMAGHDGGGHAHSNALTVAAGESDTLTMTFEKPGSLLIGCHEAGHYAAGMVGTLEVVE